METEWGWLIAIYLFLGGLGAGAFLTAAAFELTGKRDQFDPCAVTLVGAVAPGPLVALGAVLLIFDLGIAQWEPWRILYMFIHASSAMTWGIWILSMFILLSFIYGFLEIVDTYPAVQEWLKNRWWLKWLAFLPPVPLRRVKRVVVIIGSVFALGTAIYTGVLLSIVGPAVPFWSTPILPFVPIPLLPVLFLVSAVATGVGLTVDVAANLSSPDMMHHLRRMPAIHLAIIGVETLLLGFLLITALFDGGVAALAARAIVAGPHSIIFWVLIVLPGFVFPFIVHAHAAGSGRHRMLLGLGSGIGTVLAGLFLRYLIIISGAHVAL